MKDGTGQMEIESLTDYQPPADALEGRVVLVTGAGAGIGRAVSVASAAHGATVVLMGRTQANLETVYDEIVSAGSPEPGIFVIDFERAGPDQYTQIFEALQATYGRLDGIVHNAGILGDRSPIEHYDVKTWHRVLHVNLTTPFLLTRTLMPLLRCSEDASIIFTSSGVGRVGKPFWGAYAVSKFGTESLMQVLASELEGSPNIRSNALNPGATRTAMRRQAYPGEDPDTLPSPDQIAPAYLYLLGPDSKGVNGRSFDAQ